MEPKRTIWPWLVPIAFAGAATLLAVTVFIAAGLLIASAFSQG